MPESPLQGGIRDILTRCQNHLRSSQSSPSPSWKTQLLLLSVPLRENPATHRKLTSAALFYDFNLSVTDHRWGEEHRSTGKLSELSSLFTTTDPYRGYSTSDAALIYIWVSFSSHMNKIPRSSNSHTWSSKLPPKVEKTLHPSSSPLHTWRPEDGGLLTPTRPTHRWKAQIEFWDHQTGAPLAPGCTEEVLNRTDLSLTYCHQCRKSNARFTPSEAMNAWGEISS